MLEFLEPLHPKMVHFPVAFFITALGFEIVSWITKKETFHRCAVYLYVLAALFTPLVVWTGSREAEKLHLNHPLLDQHRQYALWTMWSTLMSLPFLWLLYHKHRKAYRVVLVVCLISASCLVTLAGDKGGRMVFEYGVGTELF